MTRFKLQRPLIVFDLETTGTDPQNDRIVELAAIKLFPEGSREERCRRFNPTIPIPPASTAIHGITDDDVKDAPTFARVARGAHGIAQFFTGADLAGYNLLAFDIPVLLNELARADLDLDLTGVAVIDAFKIFVEHEPRDLSGALRFYCQRELEGAHGAAADTQATLDVLEAQLQRYADLAETPAALNARHPDDVDLQGRLRWVKDQVVINFGKHQGRTLKQVIEAEPNYLKWMLKKHIATDAASMLRAALEGDFPSRGGTDDATSESAPEAPPVS